MPKTERTEAQKEADAAFVARTKARAAERRAAKEQKPVESGPSRDAITALGGPAAPEDTITVPVSALDDLIAAKVAAILAARTAAGVADAALVPVHPEVPSKPFWSFVHEDSPAFAKLLPPELRRKTQDGYVRFRPDGIPKNKQRIRRGRLVTDDEEVATWLLGEIGAGRAAGVYADNDQNRLRLLNDEIAALSA